MLSGKGQNPFSPNDHRPTLAHYIDRLFLNSFGGTEINLRPLTQYRAGFDIGIMDANFNVDNENKR
jgi:hypothetical protein